MPQGSILCFNETVTIQWCAQGYVSSMFEYALWKLGPVEEGDCSICVIG